MKLLNDSIAKIVNSHSGFAYLSKDVSFLTGMDMPFC